MFKSMASILSPTVTSHDQNQSFDESDDPERSDPAVNSDALPDDHPIHLLPEARAFYRSGRTPPFVLNKRSEVIKSVVIPTKNGLRPKDEKAIKVRIVAKVCAFKCGFFPLGISLESGEDLLPPPCSMNLSHDSTLSSGKGMLTRESSLALG